MILAYTRTPSPDEPDNTPPAPPTTAEERWPNLPRLWEQARQADDDINGAYQWPW